MNKLIRLSLTVILLPLWNHSNAQNKGFIDLAGLDAQIKPGVISFDM